MEKLTQLIAALILLVEAATEYLEKKTGEPYQPELLPTASAAAPVKAKKEKKVEAPVTDAPAATAPATTPQPEPSPFGDVFGGTEQAPAANTPAPATAPSEAKKPEVLTDDQAREKLVKVANMLIQARKNATPDGNVIIMTTLKTVFQKERLRDLDYTQRIDAIAIIEKELNSK